MAASRVRCVDHDKKLIILPGPYNFRHAYSKKGRLGLEVCTSKTVVLVNS